MRTLAVVVVVAMVMEPHVDSLAAARQTGVSPRGAPAIGGSAGAAAARRS